MTLGAVNWRIIATIISHDYKSSGTVKTVSRTNRLKSCSPITYPLSTVVLPLTDSSLTTNAKPSPLLQTMPTTKAKEGNPPAEPNESQRKKKKGQKSEKSQRPEPVPRNTFVWFRVKLSNEWMFTACHRVNWTHELSEKMLSIIIEDAQLHQGLFLGPGTTQNDETGSNKLPKSDFEWMVAQRLFESDAAYASVFRQSMENPKGRSQWVTKVKNRLTQ